MTDLRLDGSFFEAVGDNGDSSLEEAVCDNGVDEAVDSAMWPASDITAVGGVGDVTSATGTGDMTTGFGDSMGPQGDVTATAAANVDKPTMAPGAVDEAVSGDGTVTSSGATETTDTGDYNICI